MRYFQTVEEVFRFAISLEEDNCLFYDSLMLKTNSKSLQAVIKEFIQHERDHINTLEKLMETCNSDMIHKAMSLKISNYTPPMDMDMDQQINITYKDMLSLAIKKENACYKLYSDLARSASDADIRDTFLQMASQEGHHRLAFQREYNDQKR